MLGYYKKMMLSLLSLGLIAVAHAAVSDSCQIATDKINEDPEIVYATSQVYSSEAQISEGTTSASIDYYNTEGLKAACDAYGTNATYREFVLDLQCTAKWDGGKQNFDLYLNNAPGCYSTSCTETDFTSFQDQFGSDRSGDLAPDSSLYFACSDGFRAVTWSFGSALGVVAFAASSYLF